MRELQEFLDLTISEVLMTTTKNSNEYTDTVAPNVDLCKDYIQLIWYVQVDHRLSETDGSIDFHKDASFLLCWSLHIWSPVNQTPEVLEVSTLIDHISDGA